MKANYIFGVRPIIEALESNQSIGKIYLKKDRKESLFEIEYLARKQGIPISYVPIEKLNNLTKEKAHQGVVASMSAIDFEEIEPLLERITQQNKKALLLLLDGVTDVRNLGSIIRTAYCAGVDAVVIPGKGSAPITSDTVKTSAGAIFNIPICKVNHIKDAVFYLKSYNINVIAANEKADKVLYKTNFKESIAIVLGAEKVGISPSVLKLADEQVKLPVYNSISSLNVSVAASLFIYEAIRQRNYSF